MKMLNGIFLRISKNNKIKIYIYICESKQYLCKHKLEARIELLTHPKCKGYSNFIEFKFPSLCLYYGVVCLQPWFVCLLSSACSVMNQLFTFLHRGLFTFFRYYSLYSSLLLFIYFSEYLPTIMYLPISPADEQFEQAWRAPRIHFTSHSRWGNILQR